MEPFVGLQFFIYYVIMAAGFLFQEILRAVYHELIAEPCSYSIYFNFKYFMNFKHLNIVNYINFLKFEIFCKIKYLPKIIIP
jgi:hypothetical protein